MAYIKPASLLSRIFSGLSKDVTSDPWNIKTSAAMADGLQNKYLGYQAQTAQTLLMKQGLSDFGCHTLTTVLNFLSAFILGENAIPMYNGEDDKEKELFNEWVREFLTFNNTHLGTFRDVVNEAVTFGRAVTRLSVETKNDGTKGIKVWNVSQEVEAYNILDAENNAIGACVDWDPELVNWLVKLTPSASLGSDTQEIVYKAKENHLGLLNFSLLSNPNEPSYKPHLCLTEIENMDKALKDMRAINDKGARITPTWKVETDAEYSQLQAILAASEWKIGQAVAGTGEFKYEVADTGKALKGVLQEFETNGQTVSSTCNVPVHYIALTTLMSNRSTAETLYDVILHGTALERERLKDFLKDTYIRAQKMSIDMKGSKLTKAITNFDVPIEVIDKSRFKEMVEAYSILHADRVISKKGYRKIVPNVDPKEEDEAIEKETGYQRFEDDDSSADDIEN